MKKALAVFFILVLAFAPLSASTHKTCGVDKVYVGLVAGYNGVRDSVMSVLVKVMAMILSLGAASDSLVIHGDNALALGMDGYFELTPGLSLSATAGCSIDWTSDGDVVPAPFGDMLLYWRLNGGERGDFLLGSGIGTFAPMGDSGTTGYLSLLGSMRYQLDVTSSMGWWIDMSAGWSMFRYGAGGFDFIDDEFLVTPSLRTGLSFSF